MERSYLIEAGAAFGDGMHPSTALALWMLATLPEEFAPSHALDVGCGSGILSLAVALKWQIPVIASDIAVEAVEQTRANAEVNGARELITAVRADSAHHPEISAHAPYDLLVSNILTDLHIRNARHFASLLAPGGRMLLSGILQWRMAELLGYYAALGWEAQMQEREGDWAAVIIKHKEDSQ